MKLKLLSATLVALTVNSIAKAEDNGWYIGLSANQADVSRVETTSNQQVANVTRRIEIDTDDETGFGITFGRNLFTQANGNKLSVEISYADSDHDLEELQFMNAVFLASDGRAGGSLEVETILARLKYQFDLGRFQPYLGLGIGESDLTTQAVYGMSVGSAIGSVPPFASGSDSATAFELRAGIEYQISDTFGLFIEYTSTDVDDIEFDRLGGGPGGLTTTIQSGDFDVDSVNLGANIRF